MAQDSGAGEILKWGLILGGGYLLWSWFVGQQQAAAAATVPATGSTGSTGSTTTTGATTPATATAPTPGLVIPSNLSVTKTINNALQGTVSLNGESVQIAIITGNSPATSGVIYNTSGADITNQFTAAQQAQLVQAFLLAPQNAGTGTSGFGNVFILPRLYMLGAGRRAPGRIGAA